MTWTAETFSLSTLVIAWVCVLAIIYFLPSHTRPDFEEKRLLAELAKLEKEVTDLAEDLHAINPNIRERRGGERDFDKKLESKKTK